MIDVHPNPPEALVDGAQALLPEELSSLVRDLHKVWAAVRG
jgi:3-deoxy-D-arabino-heptulosonate 7-phosphate (DAHP) synthase